MFMTVGFAILGIEITRDGQCFAKKIIVLNCGMNLNGAVSFRVMANRAK